MKQLWYKKEDGTYKDYTKADLIRFSNRDKGTKDGFKATTISKNEFQKLTTELKAQATIEEIDESMRR